MTADEKRFLIAALRAEFDAIIAHAGDVLFVQIVERTVELERERAGKGPRHG